MTEVVPIWRRTKEISTYFGKKGRVESFTRILQAPAGFEKQTPFWVGIIKFSNGKKVTAQLVDGKKIKVGSKVVGVLRRIRTAEKDEVVEYGIKYKLI
jgi:hypothetical protein